MQVGQALVDKHTPIESTLRCPNGSITYYQAIPRHCH